MATERLGWIVGLAAISAATIGGVMLIASKSASAQPPAPGPKPPPPKPPPPPHGGGGGGKMQCWDGTWVDDLSNCPPEYVTCADGSVVPYPGDTCPQ